MITRIFLASSSPRRRELLARPGLRFTVVEPPDEEAPPAPGMCADLAVQLTARGKAVAVAAGLPEGAFVISADTVVVGPSGPMGKPHTRQRAREMLLELSGRRHTVLTGICAIAAPSGEEALGVSRSAVKMRPITETEIDQYVATGEPLDKAGGYAIQGIARDFVDAVGGRVDTVVGLDVAMALALLSRIGFPVPLPSAPDIPMSPMRSSRRPLSPARAAQRV